jgi:D-cysteine desulfhydrase
VNRVGRRTALVGAAALAWAGPLGMARAATTPLPLERARPGLAGKLPRAGLWDAPAPVHPAPALAKELGLIHGLWLVRDDLGGTAFAGGKARKLDLLLGEALRLGARQVVTTGGTGSNHARSTALGARAVGLDCRLALLPEPPSAPVRRNLLAMVEAGAQIAVGSREAVERARKDAVASGGRSIWIPMGGTAPLADMAFVSAALEIAERVQAGEIPAPGRVVTALGSVGSAIGLALGFALAGLPTRVLAVRCSSPATSSPAVIDAELVAAAALLAQLDPIAPRIVDDARARLVVDGAELGGGYGRPTAASTRALRQLADREGVTVDPTYTAKAAAALSRRSAELGRGPVLLWLGCDARWLAGETGAAR